MAKRFGAELIVLHVVDLPPSWFGSPEASVWATLIDANRLREAGRVALDRFIAEQFSGTPVIPESSEGDVALLIAECARDDRADLIMMPTRGYGPFRATLLGSVTAKVLHDAHCPVWTGVHAKQIMAHSPDRWKRMLCALDANSRDLGVLHWAASFAAEHGLELRLVHAVPGCRHA
jgi:nucleotide-binding universal stress UspA family protein